MLRSIVHEDFAGEADLIERLFRMMDDNTQVKDDTLLPKTGYGKAFERRCSSINTESFINQRSGKLFGRMATTVALWRTDGTCIIVERTFDGDRTQINSV